MRKGLALVEILVMISIFAIFTAIALPDILRKSSYSSSQHRLDRGDCVLVNGLPGVVLDRVVDYRGDTLIVRLMKKVDGYDQYYTAEFFESEINWLPEEHTSEKGVE